MIADGEGSHSRGSFVWFEGEVVWRMYSEWREAMLDGREASASCSTL